MEHGGLVSNTWVTCLEVGDTPWKHGIIPNTRLSLEAESERGDCLALRGACGSLAGWWGKGLPRRR